MSQSTHTRLPVKPIRPTQPGRPRPTSEVTDVDISPAGKGTGALFFLNIWQGTRFTTYWLLPLVCPEGVAWQFQASRTKEASPMQADSYDVALFFDGDTCDCPGHARFGHCKHVAALRLLVEQGHLPPGPDCPPVPDPDDLGQPCGSQFDVDPPF